MRRPRRNRKSAAIRAMVQETTLSMNDFIFPLFFVIFSLYINLKFNVLLILTMVYHGLPTVKF